jgi:Glycogen recognition site of AMP-activated protein kinase
MSTDSGFILPVYIDTGTYTYRYVVDGQWMIDPGNKFVVPNDHNDFNSVVMIGEPYNFVLPGFTDKSEVFLAGSFNQWRKYEWKMQRTTTGWELPIALASGNYEFKFFIEGIGYLADGKASAENEPGSVFVTDPNHRFTLKGFQDAKQIFVAGSFNLWSPNAYPMRKDSTGWSIDLHISKGKHLYKYIIDGKWVIDPDNPLWEENEYQTGNSILWIE